MRIRRQDVEMGASGGDSETELPLDMQLDLLVDEELREDARSLLLARMEMEPGRWRELALRFLQRQVERRAARELIAGGRMVDVDIQGELQEASLGMNRMWGGKGGGWMGTRGMTRVAAGLLIATTSALITVQVMRGGPMAKQAPRVRGEDLVQANLPGSSVGLERPVSVEVPVANGMRESGNPWEFLKASSDGPMPRRSVVIQPDGTGNALVIPVNTLPVNVY
ncbi:MAG TPA: hypothetical protein VH253_10370 [Phycisphaerae bacterium]|nr:hypothetical protein [Phycisphaerae bacterium]